MKHVVHPVALLRKQSAVASGERLEVAAKSNELSVPSPDVSRDSLPATASSKAKPLLFGFYGFARHEQGVDVLMEALEILQRRGEMNAEFRVLWPQGFRLPDGRWLERSLFEHLAPAVVFLDRPIDPEEYLQVLADTDWLLLPYRINSYEGRRSRISVEACILGIPAVYTRGTDLEDVFGTHGAGISVAEENPEALAEAIRVAVNEHDTFRRQALERRAQAQEFYSGQRFIEQIREAFAQRGH